MGSIAPLRSSDLEEVVEPIDLGRAEAAVRELLLALGQDPSRDGLRDTPRRVAKMYQELLEGQGAEPSEHLGTTFAAEYDGAVVLRDIGFSSLCEHHLLPFIGTAHVAYLPGTRVVGLSKLARTVRVFARRPQIQERMTSQIADTLMEHLDARGVLVRVEARHMCMQIRGVNDRSAQMVTMAARGLLRDDRAARAEVTSLLGE
jgi:GTP cyclohydrolase I